jgi:hypothetical protein
MGLNRRTSTSLTIVLGAAVAASTWVAGAQAQGQGQPPPVAGQPPPLSALPSILRLQPDQRDAWRTYTDAIAQDRATHPNPSDLAQSLNLMQTPARLDAMVDQMKSDEAAFQRRAAATKAFYAVLTPDQKQTFDTITRLPTAPPQAPPPSSYRPPQSTLPQPSNPQALPPPGGAAPQ